MTDPAHHQTEDPVTRRVREAFAHLEPSVELNGVIERAAPYLRRMSRPARRDQQPASQAPTGERRRLAAVRPAWTSSPGGELDPPASQPVALAADRHPGTRRTPGVVTVGGVELSPADLVAARRRDPAALTRIYQAYTPALLRFFVAAVGDRHAAEDLTGTVFAAAVEDLPGFRGELDRFGSWLFRIARHDLYDYRRRVARARTENSDDVLDEAALAEEPPDRWERPVEQLEASRVMAAMAQLSTDQREVLLLRLAAGLTIGEVAATLGKTIGAVKALQRRGLASLARKLEATVADQPHGDHGWGDGGQQGAPLDLPEHPDGPS
jgi:RNA polymerase sigma factor (sigma-70 family)